MRVQLIKTLPPHHPLTLYQHPHTPTYCPAGAKVTVALCGVEVVPLVCGPRPHADEVSDEGRNVALEDGRVTPDHILV